MQSESHDMTGLKGYICRNENLVWRDIAGEVVIAERDNGTIRVLNKTASFFWALSDGSRNIDDIVSSICQRYEVSEDESRQDSIEFCQQLVEAGLLSISK